MFRTIISLAIFVAFMVIPLTSSAAPITVPTGLNPGDQYRLVFVTSTPANPTSTQIVDYNAFVTSAANSVPELVALGTTWKAIASTSTVDARDNTGTNPNVSIGVRVFNLGDELIADDNADLWDAVGVYAGIDFTESGAVAAGTSVWTGTSTDGTASNPLGGYPFITLGSTYPSPLDEWIHDDVGDITGIPPEFLPYLGVPLYGMSDVLTVVPEPATFSLAAVGFLVLAARGWRRKRN